MTNPLVSARPLVASASRPDRATRLMILVLFALVFVPTLAVHVALVLAPPAAASQNASSSPPSPARP